MKANVRMITYNPAIAAPIPTPDEGVLNSKGRSMVSWGADNAYPDYLLSLYDNVATLRSIINGCVDFVAGNEVTGVSPLPEGVMNRKGETLQEQIRLLAGDYFRYGGFALEVIRDNTDRIAEVYYIDMRFLRTNKDCSVYYYSEEFARKYSRSDRVLTYPAFMADAVHPASILYYKNTHTRVYPAPLYQASIKACEIEKKIDTFHLNAIDNGFTSSYFINFNNGIPDEQVQDEIERMLNEKFSGADNAGRIALGWNEDREHATTLEKIDVEDFGEKYTNLAKHSRQQIFTAFRANPNLFGIPTESLGFSSEEYESAFKLFNRTQIVPVQQRIIDAYDRINGIKDSITITPFSIV